MKAVIILEYLNVYTGKKFGVFFFFLWKIVHVLKKCEQHVDFSKVNFCRSFAIFIFDICIRREIRAFSLGKERLPRGRLF